jgi:isopenicillin N synthase-like dioxygenase
MSVPTIDLRSLDPADVQRACEQVGFFTVVGHGVDRMLIDEVAARSREFFDLPDEAKERFRGPADTPGLPVYRPFGAEKLGANADRKASLDWGPTLAGVAWPDDELRAVYERYYAEMVRVAGVLVDAFGMDLARHFDGVSSSLRVIDYPGSGSVGGGGARAGAHRDYGCLTLIRSDAAGLEIETRDGGWVAVEAPPDGYVVNLGDLLARWTNGRWVSTLHRVAGDRDAPRRQSLVFFHNPRADAVVDGVVAGAYILERAAAAGL